MSTADHRLHYSTYHTTDAAAAFGSSIMSPHFTNTPLKIPATWHFQADLFTPAIDFFYLYHHVQCISKVKQEKQWSAYLLPYSWIHDHPVDTESNLNPLETAFSARVNIDWILA